MALWFAFPVSAESSPALSALSSQDPALHFLAGMAAGALAAAAVMPAADRLQPAQAGTAVASAAAASSLLAGALKELADLGGAGDPSWADLGFTVLGGAAAALLAAPLGALAARRPADRAPFAAVCLCFGLTLALPVGQRLLPATASSAPRS